MVASFDTIVKQLSPIKSQYHSYQPANSSSIGGRSFGPRAISPTAKPQFKQRFYSGVKRFFSNNWLYPEGSPQAKGAEQFSNVMMSVTPIGLGVRTGAKIGGFLGTSTNKVLNYLKLFEKQKISDKALNVGKKFAAGELGYASITGKFHPLSLQGAYFGAGSVLSLPITLGGAALGIAQKGLDIAKGYKPADIPSNINMPEIPDLRNYTPSVFNVGGPSPQINLTQAPSPPISLGGGSFSIGSGGGGGEAALLLALLAGGIGGGYLLGRRRRRRKKAKYKKRKRA